MIGLQNKGFSQVMNGFDLSRLLIGLQCVGTASQSIDETIEHVKIRHSFGKTVGDLSRGLLPNCDPLYPIRTGEVASLSRTLAS
ncbi:acyl-CoA dehydrogenase family protein [Peribacillus frigoritolerans]|nr:acyl-CoA dehydrogenase family protein [Peribacillus frigoritolerans]